MNLWRPLFSVFVYYPSQAEFIRLRDAPRYLGMDKNRFNSDVRPHLIVIPIGTQGVAFDRVDLDSWADHYKDRNGRPAAQSERKRPWETEQRRVSPIAVGSVTSTSSTEVSEFAKALEQVASRKAEEHLAKRMNDIREAMLHGLLPSRTFRMAATKYLQDYAHKKSIGDDAIQLKMLDPVIGEFDLRQVHRDRCRHSSRSAKRRASRRRL